MPERPASIEGGMIPAEPHRRREDAATWSYAVVWETADGRRAYVRTPPLWRGPMGPATLAWFRAEVERHMELHPPV